MYITRERTYDAVVGRVDFFTPFVFYLFSAACCTASMILLPACIITEGAGTANWWHVRARKRAASAVFGQALCLALASTSLQYSINHLAKWMQYVPQISHIWIGHAPIVMTWVSTGFSILFALVLLDDAGLTPRPRRRPERARPLKIDSHSQAFHNNAFRNSWNDLPQSALDHSVDHWGMNSPRRRLTRSSGTWAWGTSNDVEQGELPTSALNGRPKVG